MITTFTLSIHIIARSIADRIRMTYNMLFFGNIRLELEMGDLSEEDLTGIMNQCIRELNIKRKVKEDGKRTIIGPKAPVIPFPPKKK